MRRLHFILILCFSMVFSCSTENDEFLFVEEISTTEEIIDSSVTDSSPSQMFGDGSTPHQNITNLQDMMQWAAYITAQAVLDDDVRSELYNLIDGRESISFTELLDETTSDNMLFRTKFLSVLRYEFLVNISNPISRPRFPDLTHARQAPPWTGGVAGGSDLNDIIEEFLLATLEQNCLELFIPEGFLPVVPINQQHSLTSTAHPLNANNFNNGYRHYADTVLSGGIISEAIPIVDPNYVIKTSSDVVFVVRPIRSIVIGDPCNYPEYPLIDFGGFLD